MPLMKGAIPSPKSRAFAVLPHRPSLVVPTYFGVVPKRLSIWGNNRFGCCVSSEEWWAKAVYSLMAGVPETFVPEDVGITWSRKFGFLNGATLVDVMDAMARSGITAEDGETYTDGSYQSVDWTDLDTIRSALCQGPVKIAVSSGQLERAHSPGNGWHLLGARPDRRIDHCVGLGGYGTVEQCYRMLDVPLPSVDGSLPGFLLFTWGSIGVVDLATLAAVCDEAWLRTPATNGLPPLPTPDIGPLMEPIIDYPSQTVLLPPGWNAIPSPN